MDAKPIRAFSRGLAVLAALNRRGSATAAELATETHLPRATVYRVLKTLADDGYVARSPSDDRFTIRIKVRELSEGFEDENWIGAVAAPAIFDLTRRILWPCDVSTLEGTQMVIRESTHRFAPLSIDRSMVGRALPLLSSSSGIAYLAFVPAAERASILDLLPQAQRTKSKTEIERELARVRRRGYGLRQAGPLWPHTGSMAMPIREKTRVVGCVSLIWMAKVMSAEEGVARCRAPLEATVREIEAKLSGPAK